MLVSIVIAGLWPFNFMTPNRAVIDPEGGLVLARPGTVYEGVNTEKLHGLSQFSIYLDLRSSSDGLSAFEKIFSCANSQADMNFIVGQWKDGVVLHIPDPARRKEIHFGEYGVFMMGERATLMITYDGVKLALYRNNRPIKSRQTGALSFNGWSREYPLVIGTEAHGKSQWKGTIYEIAMWDRAIAPGEILNSEQADNSRQQTGRNGTGRNPGLQAAGGNEEKAAEDRALIHYIFRPEYTYGTEFRGGKALGVKDLGKGLPADLVIPEYFMPHKRVFLDWQTDWMDKKTYWLDVVVNIFGFIPVGALLFLQLARRRLDTQADSRRQTADGRQQAADESQQSADGRQQTAENRRQPTVDGRQPIVNHRHPMQTYRAGICGLVIFAVAAGFAVSILIEWLQAYLPSRDSSLRDLAMNTTGTLIGALAAAWIWRKASESAGENRTRVMSY